MKKFVSLLLALLMLLTLCACGESKSAASGAPRADYDANGYYLAKEEAAMPAEEPMAAYDEAYGLSATAVQTAPGGSDVPSQRPGKIIYSSNVQVETTDFEGTLAKLDKMVADFGGWVESSSVSGSNYADRSRGSVSRRSASFTLRIPSERFQELMSSLSDLGNVPYSHIYSENVTAQYYDVQARLTAYTDQEQRLLEMMELAETVEDVIILEDRLTEVRYRIESLQSSLNNWDRQVSFSSVYLDISEVQEYSPEPQVQPSYGERLSRALKSGWKDFTDFCQDLLLLIAESLPGLILFAAVITAVVLAVRRRRKARRAARAPKPSKAAPAAPVSPAPAREEN